jgi:hypothetical protein
MQAALKSLNGTRKISAEAVSPKRALMKKSKTPPENLGRYKSDCLELRVLLPGTTAVLQQATSKFGSCSMRQWRVLDRWQLR